MKTKTNVKAGPAGDYLLKLSGVEGESKPSGSHGPTMTLTVK